MSTSTWKMVSDAEFVKRPGFIRLMNALKPRPTFQFLVMSEESHFGREQIETAYALEQIMDASVRVFFYPSELFGRLSYRTLLLRCGDKTPIAPTKKLANRL